MIDKYGWGHSCHIVKGEILGFVKDELLRKHLPRMFSLINNESQGIEDNQIRRRLTITHADKRLVTSNMIPSTFMRNQSFWVLGECGRKAKT